MDLLLKTLHACPRPNNVSCDISPFKSAASNSRFLRNCGSTIGSLGVGRRPINNPYCCTSRPAVHSLSCNDGTKWREIEKYKVCYKCDVVPGTARNLGSGKVWQGSGPATTARLYYHLPVSRCSFPVFQGLFVGFRVAQ